MTRESDRVAGYRRQTRNLVLDNWARDVHPQPYLGGVGRGRGGGRVYSVVAYAQRGTKWLAERD